MESTNAFLYAVIGGFIGAIIFAAILYWILGMGKLHKRSRAIMNFLYHIAKAQAEDKAMVEAVRKTAES